MYKKYVKLREEKGVTDYRVAKDVGFNACVFSDWKSGKSSPKVNKLKILAEYFEVDINYFLEE